MSVNATFHWETLVKAFARGQCVMLWNVFVHVREHVGLMTISGSVCVDISNRNSSGSLLLLMYTGKNRRKSFVTFLRKSVYHKTALL